MNGCNLNLSENSRQCPLLARLQRHFVASERQRMRDMFLHDGCIGTRNFEWHGKRAWPLTVLREHDWHAKITATMPCRPCSYCKVAFKWPTQPSLARALPACGLPSKLHCLSASTILQPHPYQCEATALCQSQTQVLHQPSKDRRGLYMYRQ